MKKIFFLLAMIMVSIGCFAQSGKGYHGFADLGYTIGVGDYDFGRFEISTTHGYQVNPYFFVGGGVGFHFMSECKYGDSDLAFVIALILMRHYGKRYSDAVYTAFLTKTN